MSKWYIPFAHMVKFKLLAQPRIYPRKWGTQNSLGFWDTNGSLNLGQTIRSCESQQQQKKKKREGERKPAE